jgi:ABC-type transporter Mla MlaB component
MLGPMTVVSVMQREDAVQLGLSGHLDRDLGLQLIELTLVALGVTRRVVIDVSQVTEWTPDGLEALQECADLGARIPSGSPDAHHRD